MILAFIPELAKMPDAMPLNGVALPDAGSSNLIVRDWVHDFKDVWIGGWVGACFCSAIIVDAIVEAIVASGSHGAVSGWALKDVANLLMGALFILTVVILSTKKYGVFSNYVEYLLVTQIAIGATVKFMAFKPTKFEIKPATPASASV